jgi:signal transduction histidine kinase
MVLKGAEVIERNAALQLSLIEKILDISRINAAKLELDLEAVDVPETICSTLETLEPLAQSKGVRIDRAFAPRGGRTAKLDSKRFQQIIWNLISNALKFTPKGGSVRVALEYASDAFQLSIADTGKGISAENMPHLFEPLWQAEGSSGHGGLGLGLAIVRNLVDLHGGSIRAESGGPDKGAVFIVRMPWLGPPAVKAGSARHQNSHTL